ncbi:unnamed protein product [Peronospora belbahrii]|uniref:GPI inositol-deacylase n=1 Tax=Peronospora belbahrii TaxID=622444 RepID=A0AAU9L2D1_9STRA|nr:unnamed protein product [Peronospora belbahrii]
MRITVAIVTTLLGLLQLTISSEKSQVQIGLTNAPSVKLHVKSKRRAVTLHGKTEFDIYATPVVSPNGTSMYYNSYAKFIDEDSEFIYTIIDGAFYLTTKDASNTPTVQCLSSSILPFHEILPALNDVTSIPSASIGNDFVECTRGNLFETSFLSVQYAICASGKAGFTVHGSDLEISVAYLDEPVRIQKPELADESNLCEPIEMATSISPTALALITGDTVRTSVSRRLKFKWPWEKKFHLDMKPSECNKCLHTPRPCIFFHGLGNGREEAELQDTPKLISTQYGDMRGHGPCCSTLKYAVLNTNDFGWTNDTLQQKFCDHMYTMSPTSNKTNKIVRDTIVVTHSMGGLVLSAAIASGKCKLANTASWVVLSPPMAGSMASDFVVDACDKGTPDFAVNLLELVGQCPVTVARQTTFRLGGRYITPSLEAAYLAAQKAFRKNAFAVLCSDYFLGLVSRLQALCVLAGTVIPHRSLKNDGLVEFESCLGGLDSSMFGDNYMDTYYRAQVNHGDSAFLAADSWLSDAQKPHKWFECLPL